MHRWLSRFSFTFLIVGGWLLYEAYRGASASQPLPTWQITLMVVGGALGFSLGMQGIRLRHRMFKNADDHQPPGR